MTDTKENILLTSLRLFAKNGYEAVSVSQISGELGMVKSALYKHYKSKQEIFESIVERMRVMDAERAREYAMPEGDMTEIARAYQVMSLEHIREYSQAQFKHWTREEFAYLFRRMLILEQYRNEEMSQLYQDYLVVGPLRYMEELFSKMILGNQNAKQMALDFYAPIYTMFSMYDGGADLEMLEEMLDEHVKRFAKQMETY